MKVPTTYEEAAAIKYPQISVNDTPFDELLTSVILELAIFENEDDARKFWNDYKAGRVGLSYFDADNHYF